MRVIHITSVLDGGVSVHLDGIIPQLERVGVENELLAVTTRGRHAFEEQPKFRFMIPPSTYGLAPGALFYLRRRLPMADIVHLHGYPSFLTDVMPILSGKQIPLVLTFHGSLTQADNKIERVLKRVHNVLVRPFRGLFKVIIAVSNAEREIILSNGFDPRIVRTIHNGVPIAVTSDEDQISRQKDMFLYVGRIAGTKGIDLLLRSFSVLLKSHPRAFLVLAGRARDSELRALQGLCQEHRLNDSIRFLGWIPEERKVHLLRKASFFVHSSQQDVFSISVLEAMALGCVPIVLPTPGMREIVSHERTGFVARDKSIEALAEVMFRALSYSHVEKIQEGARAEVIARFSWEKSAAELSEAYCQALGS